MVDIRYVYRASGKLIGILSFFTITKFIMATILCSDKGDINPQCSNSLICSEKKS